MRLDNGLRVVLSPDRSAPAVAVTCHYDVGFRSEPEGRTGFAHLFEHLMFQGSATLEKLEHFRLVTSNGGSFNGSTRNDFTNYYEVLPSNALELGLFLESDRMRAVRLTPENLANQVAVVEEEVRVNVLNQPYGGFPWIDMPQVLFDTFPNAHNAYGEFDDLEAATLEEAAEFFNTYYAPANAVLAVAGDFEVATARRLVRKHFGGIETRPAPPAVNAAEPLPDKERRSSRFDPLAPEPAVALGYRTADPIKNLRQYVAAIVTNLVLTQGKASRLHQRLVKKDRLANSVSGSVGLVGGAFEVRDPAIFEIVAMYQSGATAAEVTGAIDDEIERLADDPPTPAELKGIQNSSISAYLGALDGLMTRATLLAAFEQQRSKPQLINEIPAIYESVTPEAVSAIAAKWLRPHTRAVIEVVPGATS
ncbi:MAG: peptidase M16 [Acidobacteria bacterium]|nr:MAG: peptidase M16 [Acidobacteriota bacterium]